MTGMEKLRNDKAEIMTEMTEITEIITGMTEMTLKNYWKNLNNNRKNWNNDWNERMTGMIEMSEFMTGMYFFHILKRLSLYH